MQRKHAPSNNKRKTPEQNSDKSRDKGKEKELVTDVHIPSDREFDEACNAALDQFAERVANLETDEVMSEAAESEGESEEFVPETPQPVERPAKKARKSRRISDDSTDVDPHRHANFG